MRTLRRIRSVGGVTAFVVLVVLTVVQLVAGHNRNVLAPLVIIGVVAIGILAGWARNRRRSGY